MKVSPSNYQRRLVRMASDAIKAASAATGVTCEEVRGRGRPAAVAFTRQMAMALLREMGLTLKEVAGLFGRTHATVIHAQRARDAWPLNATAWDQYNLARKVFFHECAVGPERCRIIRALNRIRQQRERLAAQSADLVRELEGLS